MQHSNSRGQSWAQKNQWWTVDPGRSITNPRLIENALKGSERAKGFEEEEQLINSYTQLVTRQDTELRIKELRGQRFLISVFSSVPGEIDDIGVSRFMPDGSLITMPSSAVAMMFGGDE